MHKKEYVSSIFVAFSKNSLFLRRNTWIDFLETAGRFAEDLVKKNLLYYAKAYPKRHRSKLGNSQEVTHQTAKIAVIAT